MHKTVGIISLGCPKNLVDSEIMLGVLTQAGYRIVTDPSRADILIVNTCGFIEDAKRESIEAVVEMAHYKQNGKVRCLIVTGCLPQRYREELIGLFPEVDLFLGTGEYHRIVEFIRGLKAGGGYAAARRNRGSALRRCGLARLHVGVPEYIHTFKTPRKIATPPHTVYVKIAEGCFHGCSFCAIPKMRGRFRSRPAADIVSEVKHLIAGGAKELNLIAQDTTAYGRDLPGKENIVTLLEKIALVSGEKWIRLLYAYPQSFKRGVIKLMKETPEICRYIDIPIQHIDDRVLYNMRRGRPSNLIRNLIEHIKTGLPEITLRTTVITGFPGESDRQFEKLLGFIGQGYFDHVGAFAYSEEEGTPAARMKGHIPGKVKEERRRAILSVQKGISKRKLKEKVGRRLKVLIEGASAETNHLLEGRAESQAPDIDGVVYINEGRAEPGEFYYVEITGAYDYDLLGKVI